MQTYDDIPIKFGLRVRQLRQETGMSQEAFAAKCGLDRTYISSLERGRRNVSLKNIAAISIALDISIAMLFEGISPDESTR